jgi:hypothetical protein
MQPESDDILSCPTHGEIGRYEDMINRTMLVAGERRDGRTLVKARRRQVAATATSPP